MEKCKFYEVDTAAKAEGDALEAAYNAGMSDKEREAMEAWANQQTADQPDPFAKCGEYCKHSRSGKGYPGEYVYGCACPGNEHVIDVDFNESEII